MTVTVLSFSFVTNTVWAEICGAKRMLPAASEMDRAVPIRDTEASSWRYPAPWPRWSRRIVATLRLGLINPEGIKLRELVQETGLRRHRQRQLRRRKENRLAQLAIPGPEGELASLEPGNVELSGFQVSNQFFGIRRSGARRCFSDRAYRDPDVVIERTGWPVGELLKARLELCPAPLL